MLMLQVVQEHAVNEPCDQRLVPLAVERLLGQTQIRLQQAAQGANGDVAAARVRGVAREASSRRTHSLRARR